MVPLSALLIQGGLILELCLFSGQVRCINPLLVETVYGSKSKFSSCGLMPFPTKTDESWICNWNIYFPAYCSFPETGKLIFVSTCLVSRLSIFHRSSSDTPQKVAPYAVQQLNTSATESSSASSSSQANRNPKERSPKVAERRSPRSPASEVILSTSLSVYPYEDYVGLENSIKFSWKWLENTNYWCYFMHKLGSLVPRELDWNSLIWFLVF